MQIHLCFQMSLSVFFLIVFQINTFGKGTKSFSLFDLCVFLNISSSFCFVKFRLFSFSFSPESNLIKQIINKWLYCRSIQNLKIKRYWNHTWGLKCCRVFPCVCAVIWIGLSESPGDDLFRTVRVVTSVSESSHFSLHESESVRNARKCWQPEAWRPNKVPLNIYATQL